MPWCTGCSTWVRDRARPRAGAARDAGARAGRPVRGEAQALQIPNPPITVILGTEEVVLGGSRLTVEVSARIFDFGVVSLRARVAAPD